MILMAAVEWGGDLDTSGMMSSEWNKFYVCLRLQAFHLISKHCNPTIFVQVLMVHVNIINFWPKIIFNQEFN